MTLSRRLFIAAAGSLPLTLAAAPARAEGEQRLIDQARLTVDEFAGHRDMGALRKLLASAAGALIFPEIVRGGFIIGGEGGSGLLCARGEQGGWSAPAFYAMYAGSIGLQIGAEVSKLMLVVNNRNALEALFKNEFKAGADASVAVGPLGMGVEAATTSNLRADIYAFSITKGLYGGLSVEGAGILPRYSRNQAYYGPNLAQPREIVMGGGGGPGTEALRRSLAAAEAA